MSRINAALLVIATGLCFALLPASAQERSKDSGARVQDQSKSSSNEQEKVIPYRLDFSLNEVEDGKVINTRRYSMNLTQGDHNEIKIGTRVPVASGTGSGNTVTQYQYLDVGTKIDARLPDVGQETVLHVISEISNLDTTSDRTGLVPAPIVRQIRIEGSTLLVVGKPILIGSVDDPNSKRQFQLEVVGTKLR